MIALLEKELSDFSDGADWRSLITDACSLDGPLVSVEEITPWEPGGSETYIHHVRLVTSAGSMRVLIKAFVPFPGTLTVAEAVKRTVRRTHTLMDAGMRVPKIYGIANGAILTEYIEECITDALRRSPRDVAEAAAHYLQVITQLGYDASLCVHDLRFFENHAYLVDLGSDLREIREKEVVDTTRRTMSTLAALLQRSSGLTQREIIDLTNGGYS